MEADQGGAVRRIRTLLVAVAAAALVATGCEWHFETLDGAGGANGRVNADVGQHNAGLVYNGRPHVFYWNATGGDLRHAYYNGSFWAFETLDGNGGGNGRTDHSVGLHNTAIIYNGRPHVFYWDSDDGAVRHAYYNGVAWAFETLDGNGGGNGRTTNDVGTHNAAVLYNGRPHIFYYDVTGRDLRHGYWNGSFWAFETLDGAGGAHGRTLHEVGTHNAALLYNGRPHVFYYDLSDNDLRHAYWNGSFWAFETLDGHQFGPHGQIMYNIGDHNAAVLYKNRPHVFYRDSDNGDLRHGYWNGSFWAFETLDGAGGGNGRTINDVGWYNAAVLDDGRPRVFSWDNSDGALRHAYYNGSAWGFETLDGNGGGNGRMTGLVGEYNAVVLYNGRPDVFYYAGAGANLRHAWFG